jgi:predicted AlkP superfamily pyrophosphatase or phosphodiesterase
MSCAALPTLLVLLLVATGFAAAPPQDSTVLLLSFDGTRPDQIRRQDLPTFSRLLREGAAAERLQPVFPTNTFPNHVTFVTGVSPERHGVVNNVFVDPERGLFRYDGSPSWLEAPPLWSLLAARGIVSASFHWVGSEGAWRDGRGPRSWKRFDSETPSDEKVDQILSWLDEPSRAARPRFVTAWFAGADEAGHRSGPDSEEARRELAQQDASLGRLVAGLEARRLLPSTTLLLVSDHGMADVERNIDLAAALQGAGVEAVVLGGGGFAIVRLDGGSVSLAEQALRVAKALGLEAYPRARAPARLGLLHPRFGDLVALAPVGTAITGRSARRVGKGSGRAALRGAHGYLPEEETMGALFVAFGRGAPAGLSLGGVRALDVAPTVLALLGVPAPEWFEGRAIEELIPGAAVRESAPREEPAS